MYQYKFIYVIVLGLKKLLSQSKHVTYEVVAHPHHAISHQPESPHADTYSSGWGRAATAVHVSPPKPSADPHSLAYKAHAQ